MAQDSFMSHTFCKKGIILAGGSGTRLHPATISVSKQLLPVYDKPLVYYPLSTLLLAGIRDILLISTPRDIGSFEHLLKDGAQLGVNIQYQVQPKPGGLAEAFVVGREFVDDDHVALVLGDNIFYGQGFQNSLDRAVQRSHGATLFGYPVNDPQRFGVVELNEKGMAVSLEEKPVMPKSNLAVPGLYFYDGQVTEIASQLPRSPRGELEITDLNRQYMMRNQLTVQALGRGMAWLDTGTPDALLQASSFVHAIEHRQGLKISCPEEIAFHKGFINAEQLDCLATTYNNSYGKYLKQVAANASTV